MNTLGQITPEFIYKYGTWDDILFRKLITEQVAYFASPKIYGERNDFIHKLNIDYILNEKNRFHYYKSYYQNKCKQCPIDDINQMARNAVRRRPLTKEDIIQHEKKWQDKYNNAIGVFCTGLNYMEKNLWDLFANKTKGYNTISGICVQIDREQAFSGIYGTGKKIDYDDPALCNLIDEDYNSYFEKALFTLPSDFCKENEYRIVLYFEENKSREIPIPKESIKLIILHPKMGTTKREEIKESAQSFLPHIDIKQLKRDKSEYKLVSI